MTNSCAICTGLASVAKDPIRAQHEVMYVILQSPHSDVSLTLWGGLMSWTFDNCCEEILEGWFLVRGVGSLLEGSVPGYRGWFPVRGVGSRLEGSVPGYRGSVPG